MESDKIVYSILKWLKENYIKDDEHQKEIGVGVKNSNEIHRECMSFIENCYNDIKTEEILQSSLGESRINFDFFISNEKTAIELCLSVLENELEKDFLKALVDDRVEKLVIIASDNAYKSQNYNADCFWERPGNQIYRKYLLSKGKETQLSVF